MPVFLLPFVAPAIRYNPRHVQPAPLLKNKGQQQERRTGLHPLWDGIKHTPKGRRFGVGECVLSRRWPSSEKKGHGIVPCPSSPPEALRCPFFRQSYSRVLNERAGRVCPTPSRRPNTGRPSTSPERASPRPRRRRKPSASPLRWPHPEHEPLIRHQAGHP